MESNDKLKRIDNKNRMFYYFDDITKVKDFGFVNVLIDKISWLTTFHTKMWLIAKPLCIKLDNLDQFIRGFDGNRYLPLFRVKVSVPNVTSHHYAKIKVDLYDSLPLAKALTCLIL